MRVVTFAFILCLCDVVGGYSVQLLQSRYRGSGYRGLNLYRVISSSSSSSSSSLSCISSSDGNSDINDDDCDDNIDDMNSIPTPAGMSDASLAKEFQGEKQKDFS